MAIDPTSAAAAYQRIQRPAAGAEPMEPRPAPGESFADLLKQVTSDAVAAGRQGDAVTAKALTGEASTTDIVTAVTNAEVALQTVVAVRDRVIQAYQDIMRMPI